MPALRIACPSCKTVLQVGEQSFGKAVRCPKCQNVLQVPATPMAAPAPPPPAAEPRVVIGGESRPAAFPPVPPMAGRPAAFPPAPPRSAGYAPRVPAAAPAAPAATPPLLREGPRGASLFPGVAVAALVVLLTGTTMVVGLYFLTRMMGIEKGSPEPALTESQKLAAEYMAEDFTGVVVVHPKRMLESPELAALPQEKWFSGGLNMDLRKAEEGVIFIAPAPSTAGQPVFIGLVFRFPDKADVQLVKKSIGTSAQEKTYQDKKYYTQSASSDMAIYFGDDDHTVALALEPTLQKMLSAKGSENPLLKRLQAADHDNDVVAVVDLDGMRSTVNAALKQVPAGQGVPLAVQSGLKLAEQANVVVLTANLTKNPLLAVDVEMKDANAAKSLLKVVNDGHAALVSQYSSIKGLAVGSAPKDVQDLFDRFSGELNKSFTAKMDKTDGLHVLISMDKPASTKDLIAKLAPMMLGLFPTPIREGQLNPNLPPPDRRQPELPPPDRPLPPDRPPPPPPEVKDVREVGVDWVRNNNAFGPNDKVVGMAERQLNEQVGFDKGGFVATYGAKLMKSQKPTMLVGWNGAVFPLELTAEQGQALNIQDAGLSVQALPLADDLGPAVPVGELSDLKIDHADALDPAAKMTGTVRFHRLRPDGADEYCSLRMIVPGSKTFGIAYQHLKTLLPKGDGSIQLDFPPLKGDRTGPVPVVVEVVAYGDIDRQGAPFVVSNPAVMLVVPAGK